MKVVVLYFGLIEEALKKSKESIDIADNTLLSSFMDILVNKYPLLSELEYQIAVDKKLASNKINLTNGAEIALLPPFAGG